ncbi:MULTISPECIES: hypothetical protein [Clostridium]|uniref:hypothetical protein n=1 Tax=Clostridium TaxID=1485 RepID=UPI000823FDE9|nr:MULTISPECIES: hypothetical protein [Clostridium]PJI08399.1 hypothetical protein CUB90_11245 [Clostridium sp. CT7]
MKKFAIVIGSIIIISIVGYFFIKYQTNYKYNPYAGKYLSEKGNVTLVLNKNNNNCTIIYNEYRDAFSTQGKYFVINNKIKIAINKNKENYAGKKVLKGIFRGDTIELDKTIYYKQ